MTKASRKLDIKSMVGKVLPGRFISTGSHAGAPRIALTFDDGPHPENTLPLLDHLDSMAARATFFVSGQAVTRAPSLLRTVAERGHQVANHGFAHLNARNVPYQRYMDDIERANDVIEQALGRSIGRFMRPPYGALTPRTLIGLMARRFRIVLWSVDSLDHAVNDACRLQERFDSTPLRAGDIVLFHDDYAHTVEAMHGLVRSVGERGFRSVTVSELMAH